MIAALIMFALGLAVLLGLALLDAAIAAVARRWQHWLAVRAALDRLRRQQGGQR